jgi:hypothetical protein
LAAEHEVLISRGAQECRHFVLICRDQRDIIAERSDDISGTARFRPCQFAHESLERTNRDWAIFRDEPTIVVNAGNLSAAARHFAGRSADTAADGGKRIGAACDQVRIFEAALRDRPDVTACVSVDRTRALTRDQPGVVSLARDGDT